MKFNLTFLIASVVIFVPFFAFAANAVPFTPLVGIPGLTDITGDDGLNQYINALYKLSISIAALLAVIKIMAAGAKYMLTDIVPAKEEAKKDIQGALIGLLIVIGAVIILNTVNTDLTKLDLNIETTTIKQGQDLLEAIAAYQKAAVDKMCAQADATKGENCITESCYVGDCKADCALKKGVYFAGIEYGWVTDKLDYFDKCTYIKQSGVGGAISDATTESECIAKGSNYRWSPGANKCLFTLTTTELQKKLTESGLCKSGYPCATAPCEGTSYLAPFSHNLACNSICSRNGNMSYSSELDTCYSSTQSTVGSDSNNPRASQNPLTISPNQVYKINDPAIPGTDIPAGEQNGGIITFKEPLIMIDRMVPATYNGREIKVGCELISPQICPAP